MVVTLEQYYRQYFRQNHREYIKLLGTDSVKIIFSDTFIKPFLGIRGDSKIGNDKNYAGMVMENIRKDNNFREELLDAMLI